MSFLIPQDYKMQIQADNLAQIIRSDNSILDQAERTAQKEVAKYLAPKYLLNDVFTETRSWSDSQIYNVKDRVYDTTGVIYFVDFPFPEFDYTKGYTVGDKVFWKGKTYICRIASSFPSHESQLQYGKYEAVPIANVFPDDFRLGVQYWGTGTPYQVDAGTLLSDPKWTRGDNRNELIVKYMIDIILHDVHSAISPRNIPDLRVKRYDDAISELKRIMKGDTVIDLPVKQVHTGSRIRFGGNVKQNNSY